MKDSCRRSSPTLGTPSGLGTPNGLGATLGDRVLRGLTTGGGALVVTKPGAECDEARGSDDYDPSELVCGGCIGGTSQCCHVNAVAAFVSPS